MDEPRYRGNLFGDIAAITQGNRMGVVATLLERRDWHARLLNGSDYPLPGVVPLIYLQALAERQLLDPAALPSLAPPARIERAALRLRAQAQPGAERQGFCAGGVRDRAVLPASGLSVGLRDIGVRGPAREPADFRCGTDAA